ncbi:hypothetical protein [uncultured Lactobacillus sp.]|uniref:hypothetical protein n=1 Tax=uncultured Lactobacillus sp. TaxID=153152 RepID=UPI002638E64E|nr:hypothetical protein [uncultured Lactobacillus sp.]
MHYYNLIYDRLLLCDPKEGKPVLYPLTDKQKQALKVKHNQDILAELAVHLDIRLTYHEHPIIFCGEDYFDSPIDFKDNPVKSAFYANDLIDMTFDKKNELHGYQLDIFPTDLALKFLGVLNDTHRLKAFDKNHDSLHMETIDGNQLDCKFCKYEVDLGDASLTTLPVEKEEWFKLLNQHAESFNNNDNHPAQSVGYSWIDLGKNVSDDAILVKTKDNCTLTYQNPSEIQKNLLFE